MGKTEWAKVVQLFSEVFSLEVVGIDVDTVNGNEPRYLEIQDIADRINAALDAHPEIVRLREVEKAAEKMAAAIRSWERCDMKCEEDHSDMPQSLEAYEKSKSQDKGDK